MTGIVRSKKFLSDKRIKRLLWAALILAMVVSGWGALTSYDMSSLFVRVSMKSPEAGTVALYYDVGRQFNDQDFSALPVSGDGKYHVFKLKIPFNKTFYNMRFDPPSVSKGEIIVKKVDIIDRHGRLLYDFNLNCFKPAYQIKRFDLIDGNLHFSIDEKANDPQIRILMDHPISFNRLQVLVPMLMHRVIPEFIILFLIFVFLIYVWSRWNDPVITSAVLLAILAAGWMAYHDFTSVYFRLSMKSAVQGDRAELYYDQGYGLSQKDVVDAHIHGDDLFHDYTFKIPRNFIHLRFDPLTKSGTVVIKKMEITDRFGNILKSFTLHELSPALEIRTFEFVEEGLKVTTADKASDPQINIKLDEAWLQQSHTRSLLNTIIITSIEWSVIFVLLVLSIYIWKRKKERVYHFIDGAFFQEKLPVIYLGCAFGLILAMAFVSGRNSHPDEWAHIQAASYYNDSWLPGAVDDPKVLKTVGGWGLSYLFKQEIVYWLAGKVASLLSGLGHDHYLRVRLFNAILFLILGLIVACKTRSAPLLVLALVVSSQIWYTFSYFNGDGFAFFIALLIAWQLMDVASLTNQYLNGANLRDNMSGGVLFGILVGLLLLSKMNYYVYVAFILFIIVWHFIFEQGGTNTKSDRNLLQIKKGIFIAGVALCIYLPPVVYDQYINDFNKHEKILIVAERYATPEFKPSTLRNDISSSYRCLRLRDKGMSLKELFLQNPEWRDMSFKSFFGLYGNMDIHSDRDYYQAVTYMLGLFFLLVFFCMAFTFPVRDVIFILFVLLFVGLAVGQSVYNSWVYDYEPQGRYLFPILPMLMIGLAKLPTPFRTRVIPLFSLVFFLLSAWSFLWTALKMIQKIN